MILVIDDDIGIRTSLSLMLRRAHYEVKTVASPKEAMAVVRQEEPRLVLLDMNFSLSTSGDEGLTLLREIKIFRPHVPVILMTAWGSIQLAVKGMKAGAADFITKPWNNVVLMERIETALALEERSEILEERGDALEERGERRGAREYAQESNPRMQTKAKSQQAISLSPLPSPLSSKKLSPLPSPLSPIIGQSPALLKVLDTVRRIAPTNASVLITGESGTGKELIAEAIHYNSKRAKEPFVKVNLGGISQTLFESEMFGYKKGAFTGAVGDRTGRFELADHGTIFLDEIGDLDPASQVKLLRVLQDQTFEPLGDSRTRQVSVRVVCATNADLPQLISEGRFREDLYYRINLITLHLPPLRERKGDIPLLAQHFISEQCKANGLPQVSISDDAIAALQSLSFPGNIRQLKNIIDRAVLLCSDGRITANDIQTDEENVGLSTSALGAQASGSLNLESQERAAILRAMKEYNGNISHVAEALGLTRQALYRRLEKYDLR